MFSRKSPIMNAMYAMWWNTVVNGSKNSLQKNQPIIKSTRLDAIKKRITKRDSLSSPQINSFVQSEQYSVCATYTVPKKERTAEEISMIIHAVDLRLPPEKLLILKNARQIATELIMKDIASDVRLAVGARCHSFNKDETTIMICLLVRKQLKQVELTCKSSQPSRMLNRTSFQPASLARTRQLLCANMI